MVNYELVRKVRQLSVEGISQKEASQRLGTSQANISCICTAHGIEWPRKQVDQRGDKNPAYIDGLGRSTTERATRRAVLDSGRNLHVCERCGFELTGLARQELPRHHKDRNRANNTSDNIEVLCQGCHTKEHMHENKRDENGRFLPKS